MNSFLLFLLVFSTAFLEASTLHWTMVNINHGTLQGDAHVLEVSNGDVLLIDCGDNDSQLLRFLKTRKISQIQKILISHVHRDHYGALPAILNAGIRVGEVHVTIPDRKVCDSEIPWGCRWSDVQELLKLLSRNKIPVKGYLEGEKLYAKDGLTIETIAAFDGSHTPVGETDVNDTSAVLKLSKGSTSVLFTGDLNAKVGEYLASKGEKLQSTILKVPHHGGEGLAPNSFFDRVAPKVTLVPGPKWLWESNRSQRVRKYVAEKNLWNFVNGLDGHVTVRIGENSFSIEPEVKRQLPLFWLSQFM